MSARFIIQGQFELLTPLHLGDGGEEQADAANPDEPWVATVVRAHNNKPCVPGSSLKGAMRALARRLGCELSWVQRLFGATDQAGAVTFLWSWMVSAPNASGLPGYEASKALARIPHTAIERHTRTVVERKLYQQAVVPPGARFEVRLRCRGLSPADVEGLVWLLHQCSNEGALFGLGSGHGAHRCKVIWRAADQRVKRFGPQRVAAWMASLAGAQATPWASAAAIFALPGRLTAPPGAAAPAGAQVLLVRLQFSAPFLVAQRGKDAQGELLEPRKSHDGRLELPDTGFIGPLRAQCERILRTLGLPAQQGHEAAAHRPGNAIDDLAALLFGAPGWAATVTVTVFSPIPGDAATARDQHFVAIDRVGGGGKDTAKFRIRRPDGPVLQGSLHIDWRRLQLGGRHMEALGLLALAMRDLQEGDIGFGYGRSKGFGACSSPGLIEGLALVVGQYLAGLTLQQCLDSLRRPLPPEVPPAVSLPPPVGDPVATPALRPPAQAHPDEFLNPYAWLPLSAPDSSHWQPFDALPTSHYSHASYQGLSGRVVFALETVTPTFIGGERASRVGVPNNQPTAVRPFELFGKRTIPATSLRGVISSLHESLSASNMRVLEDQRMSARMGLGEGLSAFGRIHRRGDFCWLEPLTLPTIRRVAGQYPLPPGFANAFGNFPVGHGSVAPLRAYFDAPADGYRADEPCYWQLHGDELSSIGGQVCVSGSKPNVLRFPSNDGGLNYLIGCQPWGPGRPVTRVEWEALGRPADHYRGYARTLASPGQRVLPPGVRHWQFIPHPEECDAMNDDERGLLQIPEHVLARFTRLADEAASVHLRQSSDPLELKVLPYTPVGRAAPPRVRAHGFRTELVDGDLILFDVDPRGAVSEIAFSSVWRRELGQSVGGFVKLRSPDLLPLGMAALCGAPRRDKLSPSELLFGAVEDMGRRPDGAVQKDRQGRAFAGQVRIGFGRATQPVTCLPAVTLKELSSRKLPAPALNFRRVNGGATHIAKSDLVANPAAFQLKGKRAYLHALRDDQGQVRALDDQGRPAVPGNGREPWRSRHDGQLENGHLRRVSVEPIAAAQTFFFEVDFDNLDPDALQQLCAAFMPAPGYEHRIGMGKPIGLGSVSIDALGLFLVDRWRRYALDSLDAPRYAAHACGREQAAPALPVHLAQEQALLAQPGTLPTPQALAAAGFAAAPCSAATRRALLLIGRPEHVTVPVHYPALIGQELEHEHFRWFVQNDRARSQQLGDIADSSTKLPTLRRN